MERNKSIQQIMNMKNHLLMFSEKLEIPIENWGISEIMASWVILERNGDRVLKPDGWQKKMKDIKAALEIMNIPIMSKFEKEIKFLTQEYVKERIDQEVVPIKKASANMPPYWVWKALIAATKETDDKMSDCKQLRQMQQHILLVWALSSGARLSELLRLKVSDVEMVTLPGMNFIKLTIRRGKNSRNGRKPIFYKCHENVCEQELCPIKAFVRYGQLKLKSGPIFDEPGHYMFPQRERTNKLFNRPATSKTITDGWKDWSKKLDIDESFIPQAHSGHKCLLNAAYSMQCSKKEIMDIANWSSTQCMQDYVEAPNPNSLNMKLTRMTIEEMDETCKHIRE